MNDNKISAAQPALAGIVTLLVIIFIEYLSILSLNNGHLTYTLDDPYIHLALSENILKGHYGVNLSEVSAPSSSIIWPFLIAPFAKFEYAPFLFNIGFAMLTVYLFAQILARGFHGLSGAKAVFITSVFAAFFVLATNMVGLVFLGMEHSLQVLVVVTILYGLIRDIETDMPPIWLLGAIVIAPLVRYENIAISFAALGYLFVLKHYKDALLTGALMFAGLVGFSLFLFGVGLEWLPTSISVKSDVVNSQGKLHAFTQNLKASLFAERQGLLLWILALMLFAYALCAENLKKRWLALASVGAIGVHLLAGRYGWYNRYEIYVWTYSLLVSAYLFTPMAARTIELKQIKTLPVIIAGAAFTGFTGILYINALFTLPIAANNIYEQQYQMHRFTVDYYEKPVGVNDLGYVSYKNPNYVLDLWGLASAEAFKYRVNRDNDNWIDDLSRKNNVELVMIYDDWFHDHSMPKHWKKIGELQLGKKRITPAFSGVTFYAANAETYNTAKGKLEAFSSELPEGVKFEFHTAN